MAWERRCELDVRWRIVRRPGPDPVLAKRVPVLLHQYAQPSLCLVSTFQIEPSLHVGSVLIVIKSDRR